MLAHSVVGAATARAVAVGAVAIPFSDALILGPIEIGEVNILAHLYEIKNDKAAKQFSDSIIEVGTVSAAAKAAICALKAFPCINLGTTVLNAVIAGSIVAARGEGSIYAFEQVFLEKKTVEDIDWVKKVMESKLNSSFIEKVTYMLQKNVREIDLATVAKIITETFSVAGS